MTLGLKLLSCRNGNIFYFKKTSFRYYEFLFAINVFL